MSSVIEYSSAATPHSVAGDTRVQSGSPLGVAGTFSAKRTRTLSSKHGRSAHLLNPAECDKTRPSRTAVSSICSDNRSLRATRLPAKGVMERVSDGVRSPRWRRR